MRIEKTCFFLGANLHLFVCLHSAKAAIPLGGNKTAKFHTFAGGENFSRW